MNRKRVDISIYSIEFKATKYFIYRDKLKKLLSESNKENHLHFSKIRTVNFLKTNIHSSFAIGCLLNISNV